MPEPADYSKNIQSIQETFVNKNYFLLDMFEFTNHLHMNKDNKDKYQYSIFKFKKNDNLLDIKIKGITLINILGLIGIILIITTFLKNNVLAPYIFIWIMINLILKFIHYLSNENPDNFMVILINKLYDTFLLKSGLSGMIPIISYLYLFLYAILFFSIIGLGIGLCVISGNKLNSTNKVYSQVEEPVRDNINDITKDGHVSSEINILEQIIFYIMLGIGIFIILITLITFITPVWILQIKLGNEQDVRNFLKNELVINLYNIITNEGNVINILKILKILISFSLIIVISLIGAPFYFLSFSLTSVYIFLDFLYKFFIYPMTSVTPIFAKILKERGRLLTLIFCSLVILSIQKSVIFGPDTSTVVGVMLSVFGIIIIFNIYEILNLENRK